MIGELIHQFHFLRPLWLLCLPLAMVLVFALYKKSNGNHNWQQLCDPALLKVLLVTNQSGKQWVPFVGLLIIWMVAIVALAGPAWERLPQPLYGNQKFRVIVFDLSRSMDSKDVAPSRLERARYKLTDLISSAEERQQALVVFAGDAFVVTPFTDDKDTLVNLVPSLTTQTPPVQGSRSDLGLKEALQLIENIGSVGVEVILFTDGVSPQSDSVVEEIANAGHRVSILAVGTEQGAPIPLADGGLLKDSSGNIVIPRLDRQRLSALSTLGGGIFQLMTANDEDIRRLNAPTIDDAKQLLNQATRQGFQGDAWSDFGAWLLLPVLLLAAFAFRRGWILMLLFVLVPLPQPAHAFDWQQLWYRSDQRAAMAIADEKFDQIPFDASENWKGVAAYRRGEFEAASDAFSSALEEKNDAVDHFNYGNTVAKMGAYEQALAAYERALEIAPDHEDTQFNKALIARLLEQSEQQNQQGEGENQDDPQSDSNPQDKEDQSDQSQSDQQQEGEQSDQEGSEQQSNDGGREGDLSNEQAQAEEEDGEKSEAEQQLTEQKNAEDEQSEEAQALQQSNESQTPMTESEQALQQWLKQVPDDPGGLLRRKFSYQYSQRQRQPKGEQQW